MRVRVSAPRGRQGRGKGHEDPQVVREYKQPLSPGPTQSFVLSEPPPPLLFHLLHPPLTLLGACPVARWQLRASESSWLRVRSVSLSVRGVGTAVHTTEARLSGLAAETGAQG